MLQIAIHHDHGTTSRLGHAQCQRTGEASVAPPHRPVDHAHRLARRGRPTNHLRRLIVGVVDEQHLVAASGLAEVGRQPAQQPIDVVALVARRHQHGHRDSPQAFRRGHGVGLPLGRIVTHARLSTKVSSWRRLRHSKAPSVYTA